MTTDPFPDYVAPPTEFPQANRGALGTAILAHIEAEGTPAMRLETAIRAYVWSTDHAAQTGHHPSYNDLREAMGKDRLPTCPKCGVSLPHDEWSACEQHNRAGGQS